MKNIFKAVSAIALFGLFMVDTVNAQVVVKVRPVRPNIVVVKPVCPSPHHVWIDGHWKWNKKRQQYVWREGHWMKAKKGHAWADGHWVDTPQGSKWVPGHWRRK